MKRGRRRAWRRAALTALALGTASAGVSCTASLSRLHRKGEHDTVVARASSARKVPRRRAARAYAASLVALGEHDHARAVLLGDFRRGGQRESLKALAELEREMGLEGMAAVHYARLLSLDHQILEGDAAACDLFRRRARALAAVDEPSAAFRDLQRAHEVCDGLRSVNELSADDGLRDRIAPLAARRAQQARAMDIGPDPRPERRAEVEADIAERMAAAREQGALELVDLAREEGLSLPPSEILLVLAAERRGQLGPRLVGDRLLRQLVGHVDLERLLSSSKPLEPATRAYVLLRLSSVVEIPEAEGTRESWITAALRRDGAGRGDWRVFAAAGDVGGAELSLATGLRTRLEAREAAEAAVTTVAAPTPRGRAAATPEQVEPQPREPWWLRVEVSSASLDDLLALAALYDAGERHADALRLRLHVIHEGQTRGVEGLRARVEDEVRRLMVLSRPWEALAVAGALVSPIADDVRPACAAAIGFHESLCPGGCPNSSVTVESVLGAEWVRAERERLNAALRSRRYGTRVRDVDCPSGPELFGAAAPGTFAEALARARDDLTNPDVARALVSEVEAELGMACRAAVVAPLLHGGGHRLAAEKLDRRLVHAPEVDASRQLEGQAMIALVAGHPDRARLRIIAAAGSSADPVAVWRRAAIAGRAVGAREFERAALREMLLHTPDLDDDAVRRALTVSALRDAQNAPNLREPLPATLEAHERVVEHDLTNVPALQRWSALDEIASAVAREPWVDPRSRELAESALWFDSTLRDRHQHLSDSGRMTPVHIAFDDIEDLRRANARHVQSSTGLELERAIAVATTGSEQDRALAVARLLALANELGKAQGDDLTELVLAGLSAHDDRAVPMIARDDVLLHVLFGLDLAPLWFGG